MSEFTLRKSYKQQVNKFKPSLFVEWGMMITLLYLMVIIYISGYVKFPDTVLGSVSISNNIQIISLRAKSSGEIRSILIENHQNVSQDQEILILESNADKNDVNRLSILVNELIDNFSLNGNTPSTPFVFPSFNVGEMQVAYLRAQELHQELVKYSLQNPNQEQISDLRLQLGKQISYLRQIKISRTILLQQRRLGKIEHSRDSVLFASKAISRKDFELSTAKNILSPDANISDFDAKITLTDLTILRIEHDIERFTKSAAIEQSTLQFQLRQCLFKLQSEIDAWSNIYVVKSPVDGKVSFSNYCSEHQNVNIGESIVSIIPRKYDDESVRIQYPVAQSGKVKIGQSVNIKLENYPSAEYGILKATISAISSTPFSSNTSGSEKSSGMFIADAKLSKGLTTTYGIQIPPNTVLSGTGEILTDEVSLLRRFLNPIRAFIDEYF
jgi:multidrug efflux pump subunit AcrA (membrane-fusion protein)